MMFIERKLIKSKRNSCTYLNTFFFRHPPAHFFLHPHVPFWELSFHPHFISILSYVTRANVKLTKKLFYILKVTGKRKTSCCIQHLNNISYRHAKGKFVKIKKKKLSPNVQQLFLSVYNPRQFRC